MPMTDPRLEREDGGGKRTATATRPPYQPPPEKEQQKSGCGWVLYLLIALAIALYLVYRNQ